MSYYIHDIPGRLRIRLSSVKGNDYLASQIKENLNVIQGIHSTTSNTLTGSITIFYDSKIISSSEIIGIFNKIGYLSRLNIVKYNPDHHTIGSKIIQFLTKTLFSFFIEKALENVGLSFLAVLI